MNHCMLFGIFTTDRYASIYTNDTFLVDGGHAFEAEFGNAAIWRWLPFQNPHRAHHLISACWYTTQVKYTQPKYLNCKYINK